MIASTSVGHDLLPVLSDLLDTLSPGLSIAYGCLIDPGGQLESIDLSAGIAGREPHRVTLLPASTIEEIVGQVFTACDLARSEIPIPADCPF